MRAYKGFNAKLQCTPNDKTYQYEIGKTYEEPQANICNSGFHACENPLDTFNYYKPGESRYAEVELDGESLQREHGNKKDTKLCSRRIEVKAEIGVVGIVKAAVNYISEKAKVTTGASATTGEWANAATTGERAHAATTGERAHAATTGEWAHAATTGERANAATTGERANAATTGEYAHAATTGEYAHAATMGEYAHAATTGE